MLYVVIELILNPSIIPSQAQASPADYFRLDKTILSPYILMYSLINAVVCTDKNLWIIEKEQKFTVHAEFHYTSHD